MGRISMNTILKIVPEEWCNDMLLLIAMAHVTINSNMSEYM